MVIVVWVWRGVACSLAQWNMICSDNALPLEPRSMGGQCRKRTTESVKDLSLLINEPLQQVPPLQSADGAKSFRGQKISDWNINACPKVVASVSLLSPTLLGLGAVLLFGCGWMVLHWKKMPHLFFGGAVMGALLIPVLTGLGLPAWNAREIAPLHTLARQALPALERGELLVLWKFKPRRPSVRFVVGHPAQPSKQVTPPYCAKRSGAPTVALF